MSSGVPRLHDGVCHKISWSDMVSYSDAMRLDLRPSDYRILRQMDNAYCDEMNLELHAYRERNKDG